MSSTIDVICLALQEAGHSYSKPTVSRWVDGSSNPPPELSATFTAICDNLDHHIAVARSRFLADPVVTKKAISDVGKVPEKERKIRSEVKHLESLGKTKMHIGYLVMDEEKVKALKAMARVYRLRPSSFVRLWIDEALSSALESISGQEFKNVPTTSRLPSEEVKSMIGFASESLDRKRKSGDS